MIGAVGLLGFLVAKWIAPSHAPFLHRNVLIDDDGQTPVLMDFGSIARARVKVQTRQMALAQQVGPRRRALYHALPCPRALRRQTWHPRRESRHLGTLSPFLPLSILHCVSPSNLSSLLLPINASPTHPQSLGCTLYAMAYGQSPFEANMNEQGGSMALAVLNGTFRFPSDPEFEELYTPEFRELIKFCLVTDPKGRPDIHLLIQRVDTMLTSGAYAE
ncbi:hypothetical protein BC938DRAFT_477621 [Jimgerdemannia flammicorona]|uniref:non-specific serine/threonine protein kinase n=1 Tax=Jimgerdemannia flammicorona TaxID=994334 RepID=A0A433P8R9_9FUNG|nr:hypothetical protein BC938DRAFT_477621 [Jimgerdemannia flammicorona]